MVFFCINFKVCYRDYVNVENIATLDYYKNYGTAEFSQISYTWPFYLLCNKASRALIVRRRLAGSN